MVKKNNENELDAEARRPRVGFLWAAGVLCVMAVLTYLSENVIVGPRGEGALGYAIVLGIEILIAMCLLLCYRVPRLGNRLLGFDMMLKKPSKGEKSSMSYTGSFHVETGAAEKRMNTRRKEARYSRRKLAEVTRQMQAEKTAQKSEEDKS
ncbi:hypothetical protein [Kordiimonas sp.]|uniref:hypothetical protein n=1 Tax=Kordiimonas sp. TaxID=1970157 RepID=UPI003A8DC163